MLYDMRTGVSITVVILFDEKRKLDTMESIIRNESFSRKLNLKIRGSHCF